MTESMNNSAQPVAQTSPAAPAIKQGGGFFSSFAKIVFVLVIASLLVASGYVLAKGLPNLSFLPFLIPSPSPIASPLESPQTVASQIPNPLPSPTASFTPQPSKPSSISQTPLTQSLNITTNEKQYSLQAPNGWKLEQKTENYMSTSKISSGKYALIIKINLATEGAPCGFADAPLEPSEMFPDVSPLTYNTFTEFTGSQGQVYRRVDTTANPSAGKLFFAICQKGEEDKSWFQPTEFGFISYEIPYSEQLTASDQTVLKTLDAMVASLKSK